MRQILPWTKASPFPGIISKEWHQGLRGQTGFLLCGRSGGREAAHPARGVVSRSPGPRLRGCEDALGCLSAPDIPGSRDGVSCFFKSSSSRGDLQSKVHAFQTCQSVSLENPLWPVPSPVVSWSCHLPLLVAPWLSKPAARAESSSRSASL